MRRVKGNTVFRLDELLTVVTKIEACLNSRPVSPISNDFRTLFNAASANCDSGTESGGYSGESTEQLVQRYSHMLGNRVYGPFVGSSQLKQVDKKKGQSAYWNNGTTEGG